MTYTIAISNEKGGVAKTTSTLSLGAALAETVQKVLLIDLDPQANLTLALGFEPGKVEHTSGDILLDATPLLESCQATEYCRTRSYSGKYRLGTSRTSVTYLFKLHIAIIQCNQKCGSAALSDCPDRLPAFVGSHYSQCAHSR